MFIHSPVFGDVYIHSPQTITKTYLMAETAEIMGPIGFLEGLGGRFINLP